MPVEITVTGSEREMRIRNGEMAAAASERAAVDVSLLSAPFTAVAARITISYATVNAACICYIQTLLYQIDR